MNWCRFTILAAVSLPLIPSSVPHARAAEASTRPTTRPVAGSAKPKLIARLKGHGGSFIRFSLDGALLITVGDKDLQVWDGKTFSPVGKPVAYSELFVTAGFATGGHVAYLADAGGLRLWDPRTGKRIGPGIKAPFQVWTAAVSPDGTRAALNWQPPDEPFGERLVRLFDTSTGKELCQLPHIDWAVFATFGPDGRRLLTMEQRGFSARFHVWAVSAGKELFPPIETGCEATCYPVLYVAPGVFSPDGHRFAVAAGTSFAVFDTESGNLLSGQVPPHDMQSTVAGLEFSASGKLILCVHYSWAVLYDASTAEQPPDKHYFSDIAYMFNMSRDATRLASSDRIGMKGDHTITAIGIWDLRTGKLLHRLGGETEDGIPAFSPSGDYLAVTGTGASKADTTIWDVGTTGR